MSRRRDPSRPRRASRGWQRVAPARERELGPGGAALRLERECATRSLGEARGRACVLLESASMPVPSAMALLTASFLARPARLLASRGHRPRHAGTDRRLPWRQLLPLARRRCCRVGDGRRPGGSAVREDLAAPPPMDRASRPGPSGASPRRRARGPGPTALVDPPLRPPRPPIAPGPGPDWARPHGATGTPGGGGGGTPG
jgi:hypothetical protein